MGCYNRNEWLLARKTWPRAIFVSSVYYSYWPVRESLYLGSPCFGVVILTLCVILLQYLFQVWWVFKMCYIYNDSVANYILVKKFKNIIRWYTKVRVANRILSFKSWLYNKWLSDKYKIINSINNSSYLKILFFMQILKNIYLRVLIFIFLEILD